MAGLPGSSEDVKYVKTTAQSQISRPIWEGSSTVSLLHRLKVHQTDLPVRLYLFTVNAPLPAAGVTDTIA